MKRLTVSLHIRQRATARSSYAVFLVHNLEGWNAKSLRARGIPATPVAERDMTPDEIREHKTTPQYFAYLDTKELLADESRWTVPDSWLARIQALRLP